MKRIISTVLLCFLLVSLPVRAQEPIDQAVIARIKMEGFQNSQIMETLSYLTDVHGPQLITNRARIIRTRMLTKRCSPMI